MHPLRTLLELPETAALFEVASLRDPVGILSVYVDGRPELPPGREPVAAPALREGLAAVLAREAVEGPRERAAAIEARVEKLEPTLASLVDPAAPGKGRVLFATVAGGEIRRLALELPLPNRVVMAETAHLRPLAAALDAGHPAGIAVVSRENVRVLECRLGETEDVARFAVEPTTDQWRMMKGPAASGSWMAQQSASQEDRYARRKAQRRSSQLVSLGSDLHALAENHGWDRLLLVGDDRLTSSFGDRLPKQDHLHVLRIQATPGDWVPAAELGRELIPHLEDARERHDLERIQRAGDAARSGGLGVVGLADTLDALDEGRVHQLLLDGERDWQGVEAPDGRLFPTGVRPPGVSSGELRPEPLLADRMIERGLKTDATVSLVSGPAAEALAACDGVAAILRW